MSSNVMGVEFKFRTPKKFVYSDELGMSCIRVNFIHSQKFLGCNPDLLDSTRYSWGTVKLPKGKTWNKDSVLNYRTKDGKEIRAFQDSEYTFSKIRLYDNEPDLYLKFIPGGGRNFTYQVLPTRQKAVCLMFKQEALYLTIKNYPLISAFGVINDFRNLDTGNAIGRHFEQAILTFWQLKQLPLM